MTDPVQDIDQSIDEGNHLFDFFVKLGVSLDTLSERIDRQNQLEQQRLKALPVSVNFDRLSTPAGTTDLQDFDGPQPGREWHIRLLSAIAVPLAANASVVTWYVGQRMPGPAAGMLPASLAVWQFASVPAFQNFTSDVIVVRNGERLIAGLTGVPASSAISLGVAVNDQPAGSGRFPVALT